MVAIPLNDRRIFSRAIWATATLFILGYRQPGRLVLLPNAVDKVFRSYRLLVSTAPVLEFQDPFALKNFDPPAKGGAMLHLVRRKLKYIRL